MPPCLQPSSTPQLILNGETPEAEVVRPFTTARLAAEAEMKMEIAIQAGAVHGNC